MTVTTNPVITNPPLTSPTTTIETSIKLTPESNTTPPPSPPVTSPVGTQNINPGPAAQALTVTETIDLLDGAFIPGFTTIPMLLGLGLMCILARKFRK